MKHIAIVSALFLSACVTMETGEVSKPVGDPIERAETRIALGIGYMEQGDMGRARENLELALKHAPSYYRAQITLAHYFEQVGENDAAHDMYKRSLRQNPRNGNVLNNFGTFLCKQGDYQTADRYFNRAIEQPYYYLISASYENAAFCAAKSGNDEKARHYFERTLDYDPNRPRSILHLAKLEIDSQDFTEARLRLMRFHQSYGLTVPSLSLLVSLESKAGNKALETKYQSQLDKLKAKQAS